MPRKLLLNRSSKQVNEGDKALFFMWEEFRMTSYNTSMVERERRTIAERARRAEPERLRDAEFQSLLAVIGEAFLRGEKQREEAFRNAEAEQVAVNSRSQASRETRFYAAEEQRQARFKRDHDARSTRADWYTTIKEQHIQRGHASREKLFRDLEKRMLDEIENAGRMLGDHFSKTEAKVGISVSHPCHIGMDRSCIIPPRGYENVQRTVSPAHHLYRASQYGDAQHRVPSRGRSGVPSYIEARRTVPINPADRSPPPFDGPMVYSGDNPANFRSSLDARPAPNPHIVARGQHAPGDEEQPSHSGETTICPETLGDLFDAGQKRRKGCFEFEEARREVDFYHDEMRRATAEAARFKNFDAIEKRRDLRYRTSLIADENRFYRQESARSLEAQLGDQLFESAENHRLCVFEETLKLETQKHDAAQFAEMDWIKSAKAQFYALSSTYNHLLEDIKSHKGKGKHSAGRPSGLRHEWIGGTMDPVFSATPCGLPSNCEQPLAERRVSRQTRNRSEGDSSNHSMSNSFHGNHLCDSWNLRRDRYLSNTKSGRDVMRDQPGASGEQIPKIGIRNARTKPPKPKFVFATSVHKVHQGDFKWTQANMTDVFDFNARLFRNVFTLNELKRSEAFLNGQKERLRMFEEEQDIRQDYFVEAQMDRYARFQAGEKRRESEFRKAERRQQRTFLGRQAELDQVFDAWLRKLHGESFELENQRSSEFGSWIREQTKSIGSPLSVL